MRMCMRMCMHIHTDRQECSVEWKIALGTTRLCYAAFSFFSARARTFFLVSYVGDMLGTVGWVGVHFSAEEGGGGEEFCL